MEKMKTIDINKLIEEGYTNETAWLDKMTAPYGLPNLIFAIIFFSAFIGLFTGYLEKSIAVSIIIVSFVSIVILLIFFRLSKPRSPITGKLLEQYRNINPDDESAILEIVYVDHESKKYFSYVHMRNSDCGE